VLELDPEDLDYHRVLRRARLGAGLERISVR